MQWYLGMAEMEALLPLAAKRAAEKFTPRQGMAAQARARWQPWLAAAAVVVAGLLAWQWKTGDVATRGPFATVTASIGVRWSNPENGPALHAVLHRQKVEPLTGLVEITHSSGARVLIEGPASYTLVSANAGRLDFGRLVAVVPPGATGFNVDTGKEMVVDHGTEFAISLPRGGQPEVGVFRGEVELTSLDGKHSLARLFTDHAVTRQPGSETGVASIPFDRGKFIRTLPSREFKWKLSDVVPRELQTIEFDVTGLVWEAGDYRVIFKWMEGSAALDIEQVSLLQDGQPVATDTHPGMTGDLHHVKENIYRLKLPERAADIESVRWTPAVSCRPLASRTNPRPLTDSSGILLFESGLALSAAGEDFAGRWEYSHDGRLYVREFKADGTATLTTGGKQGTEFDGARWQCLDGVLRLSIPKEGIVEDHMLRDAGTLLFVNTPYRNARRIGN